MDCLSMYRECLNSPFQVSMLNMLIHETKEANKKFCASDVSREKFVKSFLCFKGENEYLLKRLAKRVVKVISYVSKLNEHEEIIDAFCCAQHVLDQEDHWISSAYCSDDQIMQYSAINICRSVFPITYVCSKYPDINSCEMSHYNVTSELRYITLQGLIRGYNNNNNNNNNNSTRKIYTDNANKNEDENDDDAEDEDEDEFLSPFAYMLQMLLKLQE